MVGFLLGFLHRLSPQSVSIGFLHWLFVLLGTCIVQRVQNVVSGVCTNPIVKQRVLDLLATRRQRSDGKEKDLEYDFSVSYNII